MARRRVRRAAPPLENEWRVLRDGAGRLVIVNTEGTNVLRHPDPRLRAQAYYLAGAAPLLHEALSRLVPRFHTLSERYPDRRDRELLVDAHVALGDTLLPMEEVVGMSRRRAGLAGEQLGLDLQSED